MPTQTKVRDGSTMSRAVARNAALARRNAKIFNLYHFSKKKDGTPRYRQVDLAEKFGLTQGSISQIIKNPNSATYAR